MTETTRAGFAAIIGAPNAGKSTLVNRLVGSKVSIVTHKVQTTRFPIRGVMMRNDSQVVLVDTPGIFSPKRRLDRAMVKSAWEGAGDADAIVHLVDARHWTGAAAEFIPAGEYEGPDEDEAIIARLKELGVKAILALNKIDLVERPALLVAAKALFDTGVYSDAVMISGLNGDGVDQLSDMLAARMPEGPYLFPEDQSADMPVRLLAAEVTREKLMLRLHQEIPYQLTVENPRQRFGEGGTADPRLARWPQVHRAGQGRSDHQGNRHGGPQGAAGYPRQAGSPVPAREGVRALAGQSRALLRHRPRLRRLGEP